MAKKRSLEVPVPSNTLPRIQHTIPIAAARLAAYIRRLFPPDLVR